MMSEDESNWSGSDVEELDSAGEEDPAVCIFCQFNHTAVSSVWAHMSEEHGFDLQLVKKQIPDFGDYHRILLINYLRSLAGNPQGLSEALTSLDSEAPFWQDQAYLQPVLENDRLLFDMDCSTDEDMMDEEFPSMQGAVSARPQGDSALAQLEQENAELRARLAAQSKMLELATSKVVSSDEESDEEPEVLPFGKSKGSSRIQGVMSRVVPTRQADREYFRAYADKSLHRTLVQDAVRVHAYSAFIKGNPDLFNGKTMLDVGCGSGILSVLGAKAGANVYAVDAADIALTASATFSKNNIAVQLKQSRIEDGVLYDDMGCKMVADVIVSEWMGHCVFFESMLNSVIVARDRYLSSTGVMAPSCVRMYAALADLSEHLGQWRDICGVDMSELAPSVSEAEQLIVSPNLIVSNVIMLKDLDLYTCTVEDSSFETALAFDLKDNCSQATSIVVWFDTFFDAEEGTDVSFSTGPLAAPTHWKQTAFHLTKLRDGVVHHQPIDGPAKDGHASVMCKINMKPGTNHRHYDVEFESSERQFCRWSMH